MSLAKRVDTTTGAVSRAVSSRRSLFGGAAAVVLGSGITAGVAASVADYIPAEVEPDAALIAACHSALTAIEKQNALTAPFETLAPDHPHYRAHSSAAYAKVYEITSGEYYPAIERAADLPARTLTGLRAKARLVVDTEDDRLALSLARDVLAGKVAA